MALEIERKFLVLSDAFKNEASHKIRIRQGYLSADPEERSGFVLKGTRVLSRSRVSAMNQGPRGMNGKKRSRLEKPLNL